MQSCTLTICLGGVAAYVAVSDMRRLPFLEDPGKFLRKQLSWIQIAQVEDAAAHTCDVPRSPTASALPSPTELFLFHEEN